MKKITLLFILVLFTTQASYAKTLRVYKHITRDGVIHYSSKKPRVRGYTVLRIKCPECGWKSKVNWHSTRLVTNKFDKEINAAAKKWKVEASLIKAVIHAESSFIPENQSSVGAQGLMQLMPATQQIYAVTNPFDPKQNIQAGVAYLKRLLNMFNDNVDLALAAYNAGENAVKKYKNTIPPYEETRNYVKRVKILQKRYKKEAKAS